MFSQEHSERCLREIQDLATQFDRKLRPLHPAFKQGGCLLLGSIYARSNIIYCGLNPGDWKKASSLAPAEHEFSTKFGSESGFNIPFSCDTEDQDYKNQRYWKNGHNFFQLAENHDLREWFKAGVTSTFLVPWRTPKLSDIHELPQEHREQLERYSAELLQKMIEHHHAKLLIVTGVCAIPLLRKLAQKMQPAGEVDSPQLREGPGRIYQWSRSSLTFPDRSITVLQIPHFSRANSLNRMADLAPWLRKNLSPFDFPLRTPSP